ncbi:C-type lectin-related protein 4 [Biomphalaria glabrata]|nr:C-type lectin-related protein 4 [Biomphalaria glabrata]
MSPLFHWLTLCAYIVPVITLGPTLKFTGNPEVLKEHIEPLTLTCSFKVSDNEVYADVDLEVNFLYLLHETKRTIASISKGQPVATVQYPGSTKVQGQIYDSKDLKDSYLQVTWKNPKLSESGNYFCLAHVSNSTGQDVVIDASIAINVSRSTMEDLASAVSRLRDRADQNEERETENRKRIMRLEGDFNARVDNLSLLLNMQFETVTEIEESTVTPDPLNAPCKPGFKKVTDGLLFACLWTSPYAMSLDGAREDCKDKGAHLLTLKTYEKKKLLQKNNPTKSIWIGLNDQEYEGKFVWEDDNSVCDYSCRQRIFLIGEPNNVSNEDCVEYSPEKHGLNDVFCSDTKYFICEQPF